MKYVAVKSKYYISSHNIFLFLILHMCLQFSNHNQSNKSLTVNQTKNIVEIKFSFVLFLNIYIDIYIDLTDLHLSLFFAKSIQRLEGHPQSLNSNFIGLSWMILCWVISLTYKIVTNLWKNESWKFRKQMFYLFSIILN